MSKKTSPQPPDKHRAARAPAQRRKARHGKVGWLVGAALAAVTVIGLTAMLENETSAVASPIEFTDVETQTREFIGYNKSIRLTAEQERIKKQALTAIRAPCCSDNKAYTCCCPCNMAKSWWGLSHHLIVNEGLGADEVQAGVEAWIEFINPSGFSGNTCYTGGCGRPFARNGCGGMNESRIAF